MSLTIAQRTNYAGFPKPGELIEITGTHDLEASDRAVANILYQHAHDSGGLDNPGSEWELPLSKLRFSAKHKGNERVRDSLERLLAVKVIVPMPAKEGKPGRLLTHLFSFFHIPDDEERDGAVVRYGLPAKLLPILVQSNRWGRIKAAVVCAMTSKYAVALYELVQLRANMSRPFETFTLERFRELMGVPPGSYKLMADLQRYCIEPAVLEVNGLSDVGVKIELQRRSPRAPVTGVTVSWWRVTGDAFRKVYHEQQQTKRGRMKRLRTAQSA